MKAKLDIHKNTNQQCAKMNGFFSSYLHMMDMFLLLVGWFSISYGYLTPRISSTSSNASYHNCTMLNGKVASNSEGNEKIPTYFAAIQKW